MSGNGHDNGNGVGHTSHGNGNGFGHDDAEVTCFAEGTRLSTPNGGTVAVEDIEIGDELMTVSGFNTKVLWIGSSVENDAMYGIHHPSWGQPVLVTKNHGIAVTLLDGTRGLAAAKFLADSVYGEFMVARYAGEAHRVYHVMLAGHELLVTNNGLHSESYFCGGWDTIPEAEDALEAAVGHREMALTMRRIKRRDADEVCSIRMWTFPQRSAA